MEAVLRFTNRIFTGHAKPQLHILIRYIVKNVYACVDMQQRIACPPSPSVYTRNFGKTCLPQLLLTPESCTFQLKFMSYTMQRCFQIPPFPPRFFFNFPSKSKRNYKIYAHRSVVAARLDDWSTPRYYPAVLTPVSSEVEPFRATTIQGAPIATYLHVLAYNSCTRVCVSYATRTCRQCIRILVQPGVTGFTDFFPKSIRDRL